MKYALHLSLSLALLLLVACGGDSVPQTSDAQVNTDQGRADVDWMLNLPRMQACQPTIRVWALLPVIAPHRSGRSGAPRLKSTVARPASA